VRVAIASSFGTGLSIWARLQDEGCDVLVWIEDAEQKHVGEGIVPKTGSWSTLLAWAREDVARTVMLFDSSGLGEQAEEARSRGVLVVGGGVFCDKLEKNRLFGFEIAQQAGALLPPYQDFPSFLHARQFVEGIDAPIFWKSDRFLESDATKGTDNGEKMGQYLDGIIRRFGGYGSCMVQEKIDGVPVSTARWWNGRAWVGPFETTLEHKKCWNDDVGPATGCAFNLLWFGNTIDDRLEDVFDNLTPTFLAKQAPPGIYDINCIAGKDGNCYFLEWTPRFGYDSEPTSFALIHSASAWLWAIATGTELPDWSRDLALSLRLSIPPYPWEHAKREYKHGAHGVEVRGVDSLWGQDFLAYELGRNEHGLYVASPEGIVGLAYAQGSDLDALDAAVKETVKRIDVAGLQYRTDPGNELAEDLDTLAQSGFLVPRMAMA
jgi:phosphoribosylamine--glycine ligase